MIFGLHPEVLLALTYAAFLICLACVLELVARKSHRRAQDYRHSGFTYFRDHDYFECPAGHQLVQIDMDNHRRTFVYRAPAKACNSCSLKLNCTDSDSGRVVERRLDAWIESELRRFHRGISLTLLLLATVLLSAEMIRYPEPADRKALALALLPVVFAQFKLLQSLLSRDRSQGSQQNSSSSALPT